MIGCFARVLRAYLINTQNIDQLLKQLINLFTQPFCTGQPAGFPSEEFGIMVADHVDTGTGGADDHVGPLEDAGKAAGRTAGIGPKAGIKGRLATARLIRRVYQIKAQSPQEVYRRTADFRVQAVDQARDEKGNDLVSQIRPFLI